MRFLAFFIAILQIFVLAQRDIFAATGGVPRAVWEDNDRNHRRSPPQIKNQLRVPQVRAGHIALPEDAQRQRAVKARDTVATNPLPMTGGSLSMLEDGSWRLKILPAAVTNTENVKLANDLPDRMAIILDPMLATGGSLSAAIALLKKNGCKNISSLNLVCAPEGLAKIEKTHPDVCIYTAAIDEGLDANGYIIPGLGDAGDRIFGTK